MLYDSVVLVQQVNRRWLLPAVVCWGSKSVEGAAARRWAVGLVGGLCLAGALLGALLGAVLRGGGSGEPPHTGPGDTSSDPPLPVTAAPPQTPTQATTASRTSTPVDLTSPSTPSSAYNQQEGCSDLWS